VAPHSHCMFVKKSQNTSDMTQMIAAAREQAQVYESNVSYCQRRYQRWKLLLMLTMCHLSAWLRTGVL